MKTVKNNYGNWRQSEIFEDIRRQLEIFGDNRRQLDTIEDSCRKLETGGDFWRQVQTSGDNWGYRGDRDRLAKLFYVFQHPMDVKESRIPDLQRSQNSRNPDFAGREFPNSSPWGIFRILRRNLPSAPRASGARFASPPGARRYLSK